MLVKSECDGSYWCMNNVTEMYKIFPNLNNIYSIIHMANLDVSLSYLVEQQPITTLVLSLNDIPA